MCLEMIRTILEHTVSQIRREIWIFCMYLQRYLWSVVICKEIWILNYFSNLGAILHCLSVQNWVKKVDLEQKYAFIGQNLVKISLNIHYLQSLYAVYHICFMRIPSLSVRKLIADINYGWSQNGIEILETRFCNMIRSGNSRTRRERAMFHNRRSLLPSPLFSSSPSDKTARP